MGLPGPRATLSQDGFTVGPADPLTNRFAGKSLIEIDLSGGHRVELTADRTRWVEGNDDLVDQIAEMYAEVTEDVFQSAVREPTLGKWWTYHEQAYSNSMDVAPAPLKRAYDRNAAFCAFSERGYARMNLKELRESAKGLYTVASSTEGFNALPLVRDLFPAGMVAIHTHSYSSLFEKLRGVKSLGYNLATPLGARRVRKRIGNTVRVFFDFGAPLRRWRLYWGWLGEGTQAFDARHPYSDALISADVNMAPEFTRVAIDALFARAHTMSPDQVADRQHSILLSLVETGLIATLPDIPPLQPIANHRCAYQEMLDSRVTSLSGSEHSGF
jgi:hypothetical protein